MRVLVLLAAAALAEAGTAEGMEALKAQDYAKAKEEFRTAADAGDAEAQFQLGELYLNGLGVTKSPRYAVQWYEKAVAQGLANAKGRLGVLLWNGVGTSKNRERALELLRSGADDGSAIAQYELGMLAYKGEEVGLGAGACWELFRKAGEQGDADAQAAYGSALMEGWVGDKPNLTAAEDWLGRAAEQGNVGAMRDLGHCLEKLGRDREAFEWHKRAALWGEFSSQLAAGSFCLRDRDRVEACAWDFVASDLHNSMPGASREIELLRQKGAAVAKAGAQRLSKEFDGKDKLEATKRAREYSKTIRENLKKRREDAR